MTGTGLLAAQTAAHAVFEREMLTGKAWLECLDAALGAYQGVLREAGLLPAPAAGGIAPATEDELDQAAQWLAKQSRSPRYVVSEGWRMLRALEGEIDNAWKLAVKWAAGDRGLLEDLSATRAFLAQHLPQGGGPC